MDLDGSGNLKKMIWGCQNWYLVTCVNFDTLKNNFKRSNESDTTHNMFPERHMCERIGCDTILPHPCTIWTDIRIYICIEVDLETKRIQNRVNTMSMATAVYINIPGKLRGGPSLMTVLPLWYVWIICIQYSPKSHTKYLEGSKMYTSMIWKIFECTYTSNLTWKRNG